MSTLELAARLFQLQALDLELDRVTAELQTVSHTIQGGAKLQKLRFEYSNVQQQLEAGLQAQKDAEWVLEDINTRLVTLEKRLTNGASNKPEEQHLLKKELQQVRAQQGRQEEAVVEVRDAADSMLELLQHKLKTLQQTEEAWKQECVALTAHRNQLEAQQQKIQLQRTQLTSTITDDLLQRYDVMRRTKQGRAISKVEHDACQWCLALLTSSELQRILTGETLQTCTNCGRILYYDC